MLQLSTVLSLNCILQSTLSEWPPHASQDKEERERRESEAQQKRQQWRALSAADKELDWQRYGKYDALHQLLKSAAEEPTFEVRRLSPCQQGGGKGWTVGLQPVTMPLRQKSAMLS